MSRVCSNIDATNLSIHTLSLPNPTYISHVLSLQAKPGFSSAEALLVEAAASKSETQLVWQAVHSKHVLRRSRIHQSCSVVVVGLGCDGQSGSFAKLSALSFTIFVCLLFVCLLTQGYKLEILPALSSTSWPSSLLFFFIEKQQ